MTLKKQMAADLSVFFDTDEFAESIIYTPTGDFARTIPAIRIDGERLEPYVRGDETATCVYQVKISDVKNPQHNDRFTITNDAGTEETWEFIDTYDEDGFTRFVVLERTLS